MTMNNYLLRAQLIFLFLLFHWGNSLSAEPMYQAHNVMLKKNIEGLTLYIKEGSIIDENFKKHFLIVDDYDKWIDVRNNYLEKFEKSCSNVIYKNIHGYTNDNKYTKCKSFNNNSKNTIKLELNRMNQFTMFSKILLNGTDDEEKTLKFEYEVPIEYFCLNISGKDRYLIQTVSCIGEACTGSVYLF